MTRPDKRSHEEIALGNGPGIPMHVQERELSYINQLRAQQGRPGLLGSGTGFHTSLGLAGLALSGGGVRSAAFNLGVLQALESRGLLDRFDYMSTVSGGGYAGAAYSVAVNMGPVQKPPVLNNNLIALIQKGAVAYLAPEGGFGWLMLIVALLRGAVLNVLCLLPYVLLPALGSFLTFRYFYPRETTSASTLSLVLRVPVDPRTWSLSSGLIVAPIAVLLVALVLATARFWWKGGDPLGKRLAWLLLVASLAAIVMAQVPICAVAGRHLLDQPMSTLALLLLASMILPLGSGLLALAPPLRPIAEWGFAISVVLLSYGIYVLATAWLLFGPFPDSWVGGDPARVLGSQEWLFVKGVGGVLGTLVLVVLVLAFTNPNQTSMAAFYRERLRKAYLGAVEESLKIDGASHVRLSNLQSQARGPLHLFGATLNVVGSENPSLRQQGGVPFVFTPWYSGSASLSSFGSTDGLEQSDQEVDLASVIAISGAAVSPIMGALTRSKLVGVMTLLNLRLGYWLPSPWCHDARKRLGAWHYVKELFGRISHDGSYVLLSDGGHSENLGIIELLRRRCRVIVASDAEHDPRGRCSGLRLVLRTAAELGISIDFDPDVFKTTSDGRSAASRGVGTITYPDGGRGLLLYLKSTLTDEVTSGLHGVRDSWKNFPHDPTMNQFLSLDQYKAYQQLGTELGSSLCGAYGDVLQALTSPPFAESIEFPRHLFLVPTAERVSDGSGLRCGVVSDAHPAFGPISISRIRWDVWGSKREHTLRSRLQGHLINFAVSRAQDDEVVSQLDEVLRQPGPLDADQGGLCLFDVGLESVAFHVDVPLVESSEQLIETDLAALDDPRWKNSTHELVHSIRNTRLTSESPECLRISVFVGLQKREQKNPFAHNVYEGIEFLRAGQQFHAHVQLLLQGFRVRLRSRPGSERTVRVSARLQTLPAELSYLDVSKLESAYRRLVDPAFDAWMAELRQCIVARARPLESNWSWRRFEDA